MNDLINELNRLKLKEEEIFFKMQTIVKEKVDNLNAIIKGGKHIVLFEDLSGDTIGEVEKIYIKSSYIIIKISNSSPVELLFKTLNYDNWQDMYFKIYELDSRVRYEDAINR